MQPQLSVFFVDDEPGTLGYLRDLFTAFFPEIAIAGDASTLEAACLRIGSLHPTLVLVDVELSGQSGFDLPFLVTNWKGNLQPVFVFISADDRYSTHPRRVAGSFFLSKPLQVDQLRLILDGLSTR